jgi:hypothetical protein
VLVKTAMASPRVRSLNISTKLAAITTNGQLPNIPKKKREIMTVCRSLVVAIVVLKILNPNIPIRISTQ